jgi:adhesin transport system outer membrane protein
MRRLFFAASLSLAALGTANSVQAMTLEEAVATAIDSNPDVLQQYARYQTANSLQNSARSDYYPQVKVSGGYGRERTDYNSGQDFEQIELDRQELGLTVSQLLFNGFKTQADVERLGQEAASERFALISSAENTALTVCRIYLNLLKAEQTSNLAKQNVRDHIKAFEDIRERAEKGLSSQSDFAQVRARLASSRASLMSAENNLFDLRSEFIGEVGIEARDLIDPVGDSRLLPESLNAALQQAKDQHPELLVARADIAAAKQEQRAAKHGYYPRLSVELAVNDNENVGGLPGPDEDGRLMLRLEYDLFNGGRDKYKAEASGWRYHEAMAISKRARRQVDEGTRLAWNAKNFLAKQISFYQENVDASTEANAGYIQQFRLGRRTLLDVLDSQVELFLARRNYISAKYDHKYANYRVNNAVGSLLYSLRVDYPNQWQEQD